MSASSDELDAAAAALRAPSSPSSEPRPDPEPAAPSPRGWRAWRLPLLLFAATAVTTTLAQGPLVGATWGQGMAYAATLLGILGAHEMGHFLVARRLGVPASPPHFIPLPPLPAFTLGTLGAVIRMDGAEARRGQLLSIGAAGPLAGFVVAVPAMIVGLHLSTPTTVETDASNLLFFGSSILSWTLEALVAPPVAEGQELFVHPVYIAAWAGFLVTALNLLPMGQLDGGHVVYALWPRRAHVIARGVYRGLVVVGLLGFALVGLEYVSLAWAHQVAFLRPWVSPGLLFWALLAGWMGLEHPSAPGEAEPLNGRQLGLAVACAVVLVLVFMPSPIYTLPPPLPAG